MASCFVEENEAFHHWKVFAGNISGVCIEFKKEPLLECFKNNSNIIKRQVTYKKIKELEEENKNNQIKNSDLPFLKRHPYRDENEFRIIYKSKDEELKSKSFSIDISCIKQILLSYLMPEVLYESIKQTIYLIKDCKDINIIKTTLIENEKWKNIIS